jgi:hypothetical protein
MAFAVACSCNSADFCNEESVDFSPPRIIGRRQKGNKKEGNINNVEGGILTHALSDQNLNLAT